MIMILVLSTNSQHKINPCCDEYIRKSQMANKTEKRLTAIISNQQRYL